MTYLVFAVAAYLLGSIPFGIVMARIFGLGDLRQIGSGNIGTTNVLRTGNKLAAFLTLVLDAGKGEGSVFGGRAHGGGGHCRRWGAFRWVGSGVEGGV